MTRWRARLEAEDAGKRPRSFVVAEGVDLPAPGDVLLVTPEGDAIRVESVEPELRTCWWVPHPGDVSTAGAALWEFPARGARPSRARRTAPPPGVDFERTVPSPAAP